mmetsp:Transcript_23895/g.38498  ORF Transcript_23895/g.38498 Transcript_23895/m.38498 type:complete len:326 (-) Transcript_23895:53-1030(-)
MSSLEDRKVKGIPSSTSKLELSRFFPPGRVMGKDRKEQITQFISTRVASLKKTACPSGGEEAKELDFRAITFDLDDTIWKGFETLNSANENMFLWLKKNAPRCVDKYDREAFWDLMTTVRTSNPEIAHNYTALRKQALQIALTDTGYNDKSNVESAFEAFIVARNDVLLFSDSLDTLKEWRAKGVILGALTNGNADVWRIEKLRDLFDFSIRTEDVGQSKPSQAPFRVALQCCHKVLRDAGIENESGNLSELIEASHVVHVGDSLKSDVVGANNAGFFSVWLNRNDGLKSYEESKGTVTKSAPKFSQESTPDLTISELSDMSSKL